MADAEEVMSRFGRDYRALTFRLVIIPNRELVRVLTDRFGEQGFAKRLSERRVQDLASRIEREGLQQPPVLEEGVHRALALASLGWDMPYFLLDEPIQMPSSRYIPTLDGRSPNLGGFSS